MGAGVVAWTADRESVSDQQTAGEDWATSAAAAFRRVVAPSAVPAAAQEAASVAAEASDAAEAAAKGFEMVPVLATGHLAAVPCVRLAALWEVRAAERRRPVPTVAPGASARRRAALHPLVDNRDVAPVLAQRVSAQAHSPEQEQEPRYCPAQESTLARPAALARIATGPVPGQSRESFRLILAVPEAVSLALRRPALAVAVPASRAEVRV